MERLIVLLLILAFLGSSAEAESQIPKGGTIAVFGGALFKKELFDLKMLAHHSKKFSGKERVVAYPFENELCKGGTVRHIQHDVLYELSSTAFIPIETSHTSIYHQSGFKEIKDYVAQQLSANTPIIYYVLGTFTSCDKVSRNELDDKFRLSFGGGSGFSLGGFYDQKSRSINRYCLSLRMNTELHPKLIENGYIPPNARSQMCVYSDDYKEGENTNVSALGLVYDKGNYFVRGTPENRVKEILIKGAMISLFSNFIGVPDVSMLPFLKNDYIEYEIDSFARKFHQETNEFQWNMLQSTLNHRYAANISYRDYGKLSPATSLVLEKIELGLSQLAPTAIYQKLVTPLFYSTDNNSITTYNPAEQQQIELTSEWSIFVSQTKCRKYSCSIRFKGTLDQSFEQGVKHAMQLAYSGHVIQEDIHCNQTSHQKFKCSIQLPTNIVKRHRIKQQKFRKFLKSELRKVNPEGVS